jgi:hypothetical protein
VWQDPFIYFNPLTRLGLHRKDKGWIYNKYREAAAVTQFFIVFLAFVVSLRSALLPFPAEGKRIALSRGKSGVISFLIDDLYFYPDTSENKKRKFILSVDFS